LEKTRGLGRHNRDKWPTDVRGLVVVTADGLGSCGKLDKELELEELELEELELEELELEELELLELDEEDDETGRLEASGKGKMIARGWGNDLASCIGTEAIWATGKPSSSSSWEEEGDVEADLEESDLAKPKEDKSRFGLSLA
jgi:hypothetical protein